MMEMIQAFAGSWTQSRINELGNKILRELECKTNLSKVSLFRNKHFSFVVLCLGNFTDWWAKALMPIYTCIELEKGYAGHIFFRVHQAAPEVSRHMKQWDKLFNSDLIHAHGRADVEPVFHENPPEGQDLQRLFEPVSERTDM